MARPFKVLRGRLRFLSDFGLLSAGDALAKLVGFVAFAHLARTVSLEQYGVIELAAAITAVFAAVVDGGLGAIGAREISRNPRSAPQLSRQIPTVRLGLALVAFPAMGLTGALLGRSPEASELVWVFALSLLLLPLKQQWLLQGAERMGAVALGQFIRAAAFAAFVLWQVRSEGDLLKVGAAEVVAALSAGLFYVALQRWQVGTFGLRLDLRAARRIGAQALSVGVAEIVWALQTYLPTALVAASAGEGPAAWFGAGHRVVVPLLAFSWIYHLNLFPTLVRNSGDSRSLRDLTNASIRLSSWTSIFVALALCLLSRPLLMTLFGEGYGQAAQPFSIAVWVFPIATIAGHARSSLIASGGQRYVLSAQLAGVGAVLVLALGLIPLYGALGGSIAMCGGSVAFLAVAQRAARLTIPRFPTLRAAVWPVVAAALASAAGAAISSPWPGASLAILAYLGLAAVFDRQLRPDLERLATSRNRPRSPE